MIKKEIIEQIKKENGNTSFTHKEILWYLVHKVDKIDDKLNKGEGKIAVNRGKIAVNRTRIKNLYWIIGVAITLLTGLLYYLR